MKKQTTEKTTEKTNFSMFQREEKNDFLKSPYFLGMVEIFHAIQNNVTLYPTLDEKLSLEHLTPCTTMGIVTSLYQKNIIDLDLVLVQEEKICCSFFDRANRYLFNKDGTRKEENISAFTKYYHSLDGGNYQIFSTEPATDKQKKELLEKIEEEKTKRTKSMIDSLPF